MSLDLWKRKHFVETVFLLLSYGALSVEVVFLEMEHSQLRQFFFFNGTLSVEVVFFPIEHSQLRWNPFSAVAASSLSLSTLSLE